MSKINLTSTEWNDLVFEGRNKNYGGYDMRVNSNRRHIIAIAAVLALTLLVLTLPSLISSILPTPTVEIIDETVREFEKIEDDEPEKPEEERVVAPPPPPLLSTIKFTAPVITREPIAEEDEMKDQDKIQEDPFIISIIDNVGTDDPDAVNPIEVAIIEQPREDPNKVFVNVEQMPEFPGGMQELYKFISKNLKYPPIALENNIQGTVTVRFVVSKTGEVGSVEVLKSLDPSCDKEAIRVVKAMPRWVPGKQNGVNVNVYYTLPIRFRITS